MAAGAIDTRSESEMLFVASKTNLLGYGKFNKGHCNQMSKTTGISLTRR